jgi:tetratricopeptide (TPR) repeat protein
LGRTTESIEATRASLHLSVASREWKNAAISSDNLAATDLTLGRVADAVRNAEQAIVFGDRGDNTFLRLVFRATLADALHQAGRRADAMARFIEAEGLQAAAEWNRPLLYSMRGFQYCDLLLAEPESAAWQVFNKVGYPHRAAAEPDEDISAYLQRCREVEQRVAEILKQEEDLSDLLGRPLSTNLDLALFHVALGRAVLCRIILEGSESGEAKSKIAQAVDSLRSSGWADQIPRGLLARAWLRALEGDGVGARADLDEAWEIAERGPMRLHMADIHLHRARLFHGKEDLEKARALIEHCGYWRRKEELNDAEDAAGAW